MFVRFSEVFYQRERVRSPHQPPTLDPGLDTESWGWPWEQICRKEPGSKTDGSCVFTTVILKFPSAPSEGNTNFCQKDPACQELEGSPENTQHIEDEEAFSSPHSTAALAEAWVMAGGPASTQAAPGGGGGRGVGGIPLTSNYQLSSMWEDVFWQRILPFSPCLADSTLANLLFWHPICICEDVKRYTQSIEDWSHISSFQEAQDVGNSL